jgi:hypothetical protein
MRVDAIALHLRPRPMTEAADLGVLLVQQHVRSLARTWLPLYLVFVMIALATIEFASWVPALVIFWCKPWLDRTILFVLSRAVFGETTTFADLWASWRSVWTQDLLSSLTLRRLSPWRAFTQPIVQLEGQRGASRRRRRAQLLRGKRGAAAVMHTVYAHVELVLLAGGLALAVWFAPEGSHRDVMSWITRADSWAHQLVLFVGYAMVVLVLEPFYVASGFAMYLNRRVELEAWDIEQEFRRALA